MNHPYQYKTNNGNKKSVDFTKNANGNTINDITSSTIITTIFNSDRITHSSRSKNRKSNNNRKKMEKSVYKILNSYFQGIFTRSDYKLNNESIVNIKMNVKSNHIYENMIGTKKINTGIIRKEKISSSSFRRNSNNPVIRENHNEGINSAHSTSTFTKNNYTFQPSMKENIRNIGYVSRPIFNYNSNEIKIQLYYYIKNYRNSVRSSFSSSISQYEGRDNNNLNYNNSTNGNSLHNSLLFKYNTNAVKSIHLQPSFYENPKNSIRKVINSNGLEYTTINNSKRIDINYSDLFSKSNLLSLVSILQQLYNKNKIMETGSNAPIKVTLQCNRVYYPYMNRDILAKYIARNLSSTTFIYLREIISNRINTTNSLLFNRIFKEQIRSKSINDSKLETTKNRSDSFLTSMITGIKVKLSGRLTTQSIIPRVTQKSFQIGSFSDTANKMKNSKNLTVPFFVQNNKQNIFKSNLSSRDYYKSNLNAIQFSEYNTKNRIGAFTIKVWISSVRLIAFYYFLLSII